MAFFPLYIDLTDKSCLIVGGGEIACRKLETLLDFDARVVLVSKSIIPEIRDIAGGYSTRVEILEREFCDNDCEDMEIVISATNDKHLNARISKICHEKRIPVNAVDDKENCTFIFPAYIKEKNVVASVSSGGRSPLVTQSLCSKIKDILTPQIGDISELLGEIRPIIKKEIYSKENLAVIKSKGQDPSKISAAIYKSIYRRCLENNEAPEMEEILAIIRGHILTI